jgi:tetratricopeptide (TPR) repeat protein
MQVAMLAAEERFEEAHALASRIRRDTGLLNDLRAQAELDAIRGRFAEAAMHLRDLADQALALGEVGAAMEISAAAGRLRIRAGDAAGARELDTLLALYPVDSLDVLSRPYLPLALYYAEAGQPRPARSWLDAYEREFPREFQGPDRWMLHRVRAAVQAAEGNREQALAELHQGARVPAVRPGMFDDAFIRIGDHPDLARTYRQLGMADSAIVVYERYLGVRSLERTATDAFELANALEGLGLLYQEKGDHVRATAYFRRFAELWATADAALQPRVQALRTRSEELVR